jgi:hypothetical protein
MVLLLAAPDIWRQLAYLPDDGSRLVEPFVSWTRIRSHSLAT